MPVKGRPEAGEGPEEYVACEVRKMLGLTVEVGPLLDAWVYEPLPERGVLVLAYGCHMWRRLAGWRIALSPRLWDRSGYARVVRS